MPPLKELAVKAKSKAKLATSTQTGSTTRSLFVSSTRHVVLAAIEVNLKVADDSNELNLSSGYTIP